MKNFSPEEFLKSFNFTDKDTSLFYIAYICESLLSHPMYQKVANLITDIKEAAIDNMDTVYNFMAKYNSIKGKIFANYPLFDIPVIDKCNLNCASCNHFAPLASDAEIPDIDDLHASMTILKEQYNLPCRSINITGGEPLLRDDICDIIYMVRDIFSNYRRNLSSNLILYPIYREKIIKAIIETKSSIYYSAYKDINKDQIDILKNDAKEFNFKAICTHNKNDGFELSNISITEKDYFQNKNECNTAGCLTLIGKYLYLCPIIAYIKYPNAKFNLDYKISRFDRINLEDIETPEEILVFMNLASPFCGHCRINSFNTMEWSKSTLEKSEWFQD